MASLSVGPDKLPKQTLTRIIDLENILLKAGEANHLIELAELYKVNNYLRRLESISIQIKI